MLLIIGAGYLAPGPSFMLLCLTAIGALVLTSGLKLAAALTQAHRLLTSSGRRHRPHNQTGIRRLPKVSILVALFQEKHIAARLIKRLKNLDYPRELLDVLLIVEADDDTTKAALQKCDLPHWTKIIPVPKGALRTKPRAMNYALEFCRGTIIGVYDAEDAPEPDQIHAVVRRFHERGPKVACLQGVLDFYNPSHNWMSRCFTIEYASWFRVILPGLARLGLPIPLGGTTLFFRREALEALGAWDAHNVAEDADLGIRLARQGYRTEIINTVTLEEANCRLWPWVRQRSRWIKGYAATWAVHMRQPRQLLHDLGWRGFLGVHVLFGGSLSQYFLAPFLWSFWVIPLGFEHPLQTRVPPAMLWTIVAIFIFSEVITVLIGMLAVAQGRHRRLLKWVPSLHFYYPLAVIAAAKAAYELLSRPFFWDKTSHGQPRTGPAITGRSAESQAQN